MIMLPKSIQVFLCVAARMPKGMPI
jgi:hypothetical protein